MGVSPLGHKLAGEWVQFSHLVWHTSGQNGSASGSARGGVPRPCRGSKSWELLIVQARQEQR